MAIGENSTVRNEAHDFEGLAEKFRVIGHPVRVAILALLCASDSSRLTVKSIYKTLKLDQPSASRHLVIMRKSGMLKRVREGADTFYCLCTNDPHVECIARCFEKIILKYSIQAFS